MRLRRYQRASQRKVHYFVPSCTALCSIPARKFYGDFNTVCLLCLFCCLLLV